MRVVMGVAACCAALGATVPAAAASDLPARVTFDATGSYATAFDHVTPGTGVYRSHGSIALSLHTVFATTLSGDVGTEPQLAAASGTTASPIGTFQYTQDVTGDNGGESTGACHGSVPVASDAPPPQLSSQSSGGGLMLTVQGLTKVEIGDVYGCPVNSQGNRTVFPGIDIMEPFNQGAPLPSALTARVRIPKAALAGGSYTADVSSSPVPVDCYTDYAFCTQTLTWKGTVTFTLAVACPAPPVAGWRSACLDRQDKADAHSALLDYGFRQEAAAQAIKVDCKANGGVPLACGAMAIEDAYYAHMVAEDQAIVADPPADGFARVAHARPARLPHAAGGRSPALRRLRSDYARSVGLVGALITTIDRASGAHRAGARAALIRQDHAAIRDARTLATLFAQQPHLLAALARSVPGKRSLLDTSQDIRAARSMSALMRRFAHQSLR